MREEVAVLLSLGSLNVTNYSLMMLLAAALGVGMTLLTARRTMPLTQILSFCACAVLGAVLGGHICYCIGNIGIVVSDYASGLTLFWKPYLGGYTLFGGIFGGMAGIALYGAVMHRRILPMLDAAVPGALTALCVGRTAEMFTNQGLGAWIENEALMHFPFGIAITYDFDDYVEWRVPVFLYEAIVALVLLVIMLILLHRRNRRPGQQTATALVLLSVTQILLEQLRQDDYLRYGFVRFSQLCALVSIVVILTVKTVQVVRQEGWNSGLTLRWATVVFSALVVVFVEFCIEKPQFLPLLRVTMLVDAALVCCAMMDVAALKTRNDSKSFHYVIKGILSLILVALTVTATCLLGRDLAWEDTMLMVIMGAALAAMANAVLAPHIDKPVN